MPIDAGLAKLAERVMTGHDSPESLCDRLLAMSGPNNEDDVAFLALAPVALAPERLTLTMPAEPMALGSVRRALQRWLKECEASDEESYDITLACNEAFANAIEHAYGPGDGSVEMDAAFSEREVSITIRDFGRWREPRGDNRGRGLDLMEAVMDSVSVVKRSQEGTAILMVRKLADSRDGGAARVS